MDRVRVELHLSQGKTLPLCHSSTSTSLISSMASNSKDLVLISSSMETEGTTATYTPSTPPPSKREIVPWDTVLEGVVPLAARPGSGPAGLRAGRPASPLRSRSAGRPKHALSPARTIAKKVFRADSPRPNVGELSPKVPSSAWRLFPEDSAKDKAKGASQAVGSPSYTVRGERTPLGWGKVLVPKLKTYRPDTSFDESIDSTPPRRTVKRVVKPPPIRGSPGQFEDSSSEEEEEEGEAIKSLHEENAALKLSLLRLEERCAEGELWKWEINDKIEILRKSLTSKLRRLAKATGHEDIYDPPHS